VWPAKGNSSLPPDTAQRQGYNVVHWTQDGMVFWAISDVEIGQLRDFAETWQGSP
jgi:anti-sigma factor RsiW